MNITNFMNVMNIMNIMNIMDIMNQFLRAAIMQSHDCTKCLRICSKAWQPRLMANHAKYFHMNIDLCVECPKCHCDFISSKLFTTYWRHMLCSKTFSD